VISIVHQLWMDMLNKYGNSRLALSVDVGTRRRRSAEKGRGLSESGIISFRSIISPSRYHTVRSAQYSPACGPSAPVAINVRRMKLKQVDSCPSLAYTAEDWCIHTAGKIYVQSARPKSDWTACPVICPVAKFGCHDAVIVSRGPSESHVAYRSRGPVSEPGEFMGP
jgi:hypothetical protein